MESPISHNRNKTLFGHKKHMQRQIQISNYQAEL